MYCTLLSVLLLALYCHFSKRWPGVGWQHVDKTAIYIYLKQESLKRQSNVLATLT